MAVWNGTVTTQLGLNLIAKVIAGKTNLAFTKLQTSEGNYTSSNLVGMTSLLNVKQEFNVSNVSVQNATTVLVKGIITNTGLSNQYNLNAIGLFATDPDLGEILFSVTTADTADIIPAKTNTNTTSLIVNILTSVTDSSKVTLTLAQPGLVTTDMLDTALTTYIKNTDNATEAKNGTSKIATQSEVNLGVDDSKIVTSKKLKNLFGGSNVNLATNGYYKLPNGLIFQWGTAYYHSSKGLNGEVLNYPVNFPNALLGIGAVDGGSDTNTIGFQTVNNAQFKCWGRDIVGNNFSDTIFRWIAIGY